MLTAMTSVNPTDATDAEDREELTWDTFGTATRTLAESIAVDEWRPDIVVAVARGGRPWPVPWPTPSA